jgi:type VI secretion system protein ImpM
VIAAPADRLAGWYGKIPALGDFASRRLPQRFISPWDAWLQRGLAASRAGLQEHWLETYLNGPIWNFALLPGVCGDNAWVGTLMPSVDKVGRHFPLTIALERKPHAEIMATLTAACRWFAAINQIALACLDMQCTPEQLESRLCELPFPASALASKGGTGEEVYAPALTQFTRNENGKSIWWSDTTASAAETLLAFHGLPSEQEFTKLLDVPDSLQL